MDKILIDVPMPILTPRLKIRAPQAGDGQEFFEAKQESMSALSQWMVWAKGETTPQAEEKMLRTEFANFILRDNLMMLAFDRETDRFMGSSGFHNINWDIPAFEIGYWVRQSEFNKGYATEISNALTRYAFDALNAKRVEIFHADGNVASQKIPLKLGFMKEAVLKNASPLPNGDVVDKHIYARTDANGLPPLQVTWF